MTSLVFLIYALANAVLFAWALRLLLRYRQPATVPLLVVTFGLVYDNAVLAAGGMVGHGELLERLSVPRFFMHAFGTPLLMLSALGLLRRSRATFAGSGVFAASLALLTLAMVAIGFGSDFLRLDLEAKAAGDLVSYGNAASHGPPIAPVVTIIVLVAAGIVIWRQNGGPWLLLGSLAQFLAAAIGDAIAIAGNLGEVLLLAGLIQADSRLSRAEEAGRRTGSTGTSTFAPSR